MNLNISECKVCGSKRIKKHQKHIIYKNDRIENEVYYRCIKCDNILYGTIKPLEDNIVPRDKEE